MYLKIMKYKAGNIDMAWRKGKLVDRDVSTSVESIDCCTHGQSFQTQPKFNLKNVLWFLTGGISEISQINQGWELIFRSKVPNKAQLGIS